LADLRRIQQIRRVDSSADEWADPGFVRCCGAFGRQKYYV